MASLSRCLAAAALLALGAPASAAGAGPVLVTGATGHTGSLLYQGLKAKGVQVRAFVRNATKARDVLGCKACDASEGIFVGDITNKSALAPAVAGASALAILTSAEPICAPKPGGGLDCHYPDGAYPVDVDFHGGMAQIEAFAEAAHAAGARGHVVLCSSVGTTDPANFYDAVGNGHMLFYKLNTEAALMSSGLPYTVVKPCGLTDGPAGQAELLVGHYDKLTVQPPAVQRADVARVMLEALLQPKQSRGLRFDLCSRPGPATTDFAALFKAARFPWQHAAPTTLELVV